MKVVPALFLYVSRAVWRVTGLRATGRPLVRALGSDDEDLRTIAGMFLVKAGPSAQPLLEEALARGKNLPIVLTILADTPSPQLEPAIRRLSVDRNPEIARAATEALRALGSPISSEN